MNFANINPGFSLTRIAGMSFAMILHTSVAMFLVAPMRPAEPTPPPTSTVEVVFVVPEKVIPPPPPPPKPIDPPPVAQRAPQVPRNPPPEVPVQQTPSNLDSTEMPVDDPVIPEPAVVAPPAASSFVSAGIDAGYGGPPKIKYESALLRKKLSGKVELRVSLDPAGQVIDIRVHRSSGHRDLDQSAIKQVRRWAFRPAERDGKKIASDVIVPVVFSLTRG